MNGVHRRASLLCLDSSTANVAALACGTHVNPQRDETLSDNHTNSIPSFEGEFPMNKGRFTISILTSIIILPLPPDARRRPAPGCRCGEDLTRPQPTPPANYAARSPRLSKDGEISTLDQRRLGTLTITKSITLTGGGAAGATARCSRARPQGSISSTSLTSTTCA